VSLVRREESRSFDVYFGCFLVFGKEKKRVEKLGSNQFPKKKKKSPPCLWGAWGYTQKSNGQIKSYGSWKFVMH